MMAASNSARCASNNRRALFERHVLGDEVIVYANAHGVEGMPGSNSEDM